MTPQDLLLEVFCLVGDQLQALNLGRLRRRGPAPRLADSEVIAIELVGEFWKLGTDQDLFRHFRRYHAAEFPALARVSRTTFARQAANLWRVKQLIQRRLAGRLAAGDPLWLVDSLPIDACQFARATFCRRFAGAADYGYCHRASGRSTASACTCAPAATASSWPTSWPRRGPTRRRCCLSWVCRSVAPASATVTTGRRSCATGWPPGGWRCWRHTTTGARTPTRGGRRGSARCATGWSARSSATRPSR